jgi:primary-amine oxidase
MKPLPVALAVLFSVALAIDAAPFAVQAQAAPAAISPRPSAAPRRFAHPLDPLTSAEIAVAVRTFQADARFPKGALFPTVVLNEPPKAEVLAYVAGAPFRREAFAIIYDRTTNKTFEAIADVKTATLQSWNEVPGVQPGFLVEELSSAPEIVRADPRWQEAMRRRGYTDFSKIQVDGWAPGTYGVTSAEGPRLIRTLAFDRTNATSNVYSRPIEGIDVVVDMNQRKVIEFNDRGAMPVSRDPAQLEASKVGALRAPLKPLRVSQPQGVDFQVLGNEVRWQKWRFRYALHPREGLVLYTVGYEDGGKVRPIMYRASLSEMVVPYGHPDKSWAWRNAFDVGEYGIGRLASRLIPGKDAPQNATYMDAAFVDDFGKAYTAKGVVTIYERDGGLLWKHFDINVDHAESRRGRELVIGYLAGVGNYDYGINWIFRQDGSLELRADLTGIMLTKGVNVATMADANGGHDMEVEHLVAPYVSAPHHQHFFSFRLDMDVDGPQNSVVEVNAHPETDPARNPGGNAFRITEQVLKTEQGAARDLSLENARKWAVINPSVKNALGMPTGFLLYPGDNSVPYIRPASLVRNRAGFVDHHFWATRYKASELSAAGAYPNQSRGGDGLPQWISDNEGLEREDLVAWYTTGLTHFPRPEDWPIMPVAHIGFQLLPVNFFTRNPAMDVR